MTKYSIYWVLIASLLIISCTKTVEPEPVLAPPLNVKYDATLSSETSISLTWEADEAVYRDALAFTVQLITDTDDTFEEAAYSHKVKSYEPRPCNTYCFKGLDKYSKFYVRVRAEYEKGNSEWVYFTKNGEECVIRTGYGPVEGNAQTLFPPSLHLKDSTAAALTFEWSVTRFESMETDRSRKYKAMLYKDEECKDLLVSWVMDKKAFQGSEAGYVYVLHHPAFVFTGLESGTEYWCKVADITDESNILVSEALCGKTGLSKVVAPSSTAVAPGEYALYEDFEELIWGGGVSSGAAGYSSLVMSTLDNFVKASGDNPVSTPEKFFVCNENNEIVLYQQIPWILQNTRLKNWGHISEGDVLNAVSARAGCIRIGYSNKTARIVTPSLANLSGKASVEVSFDAQNYYVRESRTMQIDVLHDASVNPFTGRVSVSSGNIRNVKSFELEGGYELQHYSFTVSGVQPGDRIAIGAERLYNSTSNIRFYIDNVSVKVVAY